MKEAPYLEMSRDTDQKREEPTYMETSRGNNKKKWVYK